jgi:hypothetical protein
MALASSNREKISIAPETVPGTADANFYDNSTVIRFKDETLNGNISYINSEEIRSDRQLTDLVQVSLEASGDLVIELSYGSYDELIESLMGSTFSTPNASYSATATVDANNTLNSSAAFSALPAKGQWVKISGRTNTANNGYFQVSKTVDPTSSIITFEGTPLTIDATSESTTIAESAMLRMGTTDQSFTIVKEFSDTSPVTYFTFVGMRVSSMSLSLAVGSILTGSFSFMGQTYTASTTAPDGTLGNETPALTTSVMNSVGSIANIWFDGADAFGAGTFFSNLTLDVDGALRMQNAIGYLGSVGIGQGRFNVSGNISIYFKDLSVYNKYINDNSFKLAFSVQDTAGNAYIFSMGNVKLESATVTAGGSDQDVVIGATYRGSMDANTLTMLQIDRFAAA